MSSDKMKSDEFFLFLFFLMKTGEERKLVSQNLRRWEVLRGSMGMMERENESRKESGIFPVSQQ